MPVDFRIYTASLMPVGEAQPTVVRMTGSSTEQDVQKNRMAVEALQEMQAPEIVGMNIFLNHKYELPHDLYGKLIATPDIVSSGGFLDVSLLVDTDIKNPPAAQTLQQIHDGHKHGCSIGCMVNKWDFAGETESIGDDPIVIQSITPVEWSVVGIPANRRCWVENAIGGVFTRTITEGDYDQALKLAPTVKSLFSYDYEKQVLKLSGSERKLFEGVRARQTPTQQIFWQPARSVFVMKNGAGSERELSRPQVMELLHASWGKDTEVDLTLADSGDGGKAAQKARSARYHIGIKDGGSVTKPGKWSSVPDGQWGDPVNYRYPMPDISHANNAASRWGDASNRSQYNSSEQGIIGGRIKRRQSALGGGTKEKSMDTLTDGTTAVIDEENEDITTLDAANYHDPYNGIHSHAHSHDPDGEMHTHSHKHGNTNSHLHDHTGNMDGDGGMPDGDGDQDDWNEPRAGAGDGGVGSGSTTPPNDAQSNPGRANNSGNNDNTGRANKSFDPTLLAAYNGLGKTLGFVSVDSQGNRADGVTLEGDNSKAFRDYLTNLTGTGLQLIHSAENIALRLGVQMPYLRFSVDPDMELAGATPLSPAHAVHAQAAHDHSNAMLGGKGCGKVTSSAEPAITQSVPATQTTDVTALQRQLTNAQNELTTLNQQIGALKGTGLGRPTTFVGRNLGGFNGNAPVQIEAQTPEQLREKTMIQKRGDGVKCRLWPEGHGIHQRPPLSSDQMSIMSTQDTDNYYQGREVLVPIIHEGD
jgi:hypothetical protein